MVLLRLPRKGEVRGRVPLMSSASTLRRLWLHRFAWLAFLWIASVGVLALAAALLRLLMFAVGMTL
ncbi:DUF2474 family protein [Ensifer canadensis]|uniref:DUF2474 family protein n=1 Tax=Ensifer canadensis TaxID=555315 RepID=UPI00307D31D2